MLHLAMLLEDSIREAPKGATVIFEDTELSFSELNTTADQVAHALVQLGIPRGDTVPSAARISYISQLCTMASSKQEPWLYP